MASLKLVIGNKNVSSWSMRPWVLLREAGIAFEEELVPFGTPGWRERVGSASGKVPLLIDGPLRIWDSLAICERLAEQFPEKQLWPAEAAARAVARSVSSEMHSSFSDLRRECSMNVTLRVRRRLSAAALADVRRVDELFADCRARFGQGGEMLFGRFSIADAMFAPVASRALTYGLALSPVSQRYVEALRALPSVQRWFADAQAEVDSGLCDPSPHGALFSRAEAGLFAQAWVDEWHRNDLPARVARCAEPVLVRAPRDAGGAQLRRAALLARWEEERAAAPGAGALHLERIVWDGDVNQLALALSRASGGVDTRCCELLRFDSAGLVCEIEHLPGRA